MLGWILTFGTRGQTHLTGTVQDADAQPLVEASVWCPALQRGTVTNNEGSYQLLLPDSGQVEVEIRFLGYRPERWWQVLDGRRHYQAVVLAAEAVYLGDVRVMSHRPGAAEGLPLSVTILEGAALAGAGGNQTLAQSLAAVPGVSALQTGVGIAKPVIRGLTGNRVVVNDQGVKQEGQQWGNDHGLEVDPLGVDRVEVVKGPATLLYGAEAVGGVINLLPPPLPATDGWRGSYVGVYRNNNNLLAQSLGIEARRGNVFVRLRHSRQDFADYRVPTDRFVYNSYVLPLVGGRLKNTAGRERHWSATAGWVGRQGYSSLTVSRFGQTAGLFAGAVGVPRGYQLTDDGAPRSVELPRQVNRHLKVLSNTRLANARLEIDLGYQRNLRREESAPHLHGVGPTPAGNLALSLIMHTASATVRHRTTVGPVEVIWGGQAQAGVNQRGGFSFLLPNYRTWQAGVFTLFTWPRTDRLRYVAGVRFDAGRHDIDHHLQPLYRSGMATGTFEELTPALRRRYANPSGAVGLHWQPRPVTHVKAHLGSSFRMPAPFELAANGMHHGTFRHERGDTALRSERGYQLDVVWEEQTRYGQLTLTPFAGYFPNYLYLGPAGGFSTLPAAAGLWRFRQTRAFLTGGELEARMGGEAGWGALATLAYVWNRNLTGERPLPLTPPFTARGEVRWRRPAQPDRCLSGMVAFGSDWYANQPRTDLNERPTPGALLLYLRAEMGVRLGGRVVTCTLAAENLLNRYYLQHLSRYRQLNLPEPGRNVSLSLRVPFGSPPVK